MVRPRHNRGHLLPEIRKGQLPARDKEREMGNEWGSNDMKVWKGKGGVELACVERRTGSTGSSGRRRVGVSDDTNRNVPNIGLLFPKVSRLYFTQLIILEFLNYSFLSKPRHSRDTCTLLGKEFLQLVISIWKYFLIFSLLWYAYIFSPNHFSLKFELNEILFNNDEDSPQPEQTTPFCSALWDSNITIWVGLGPE